MLLNALTFVQSRLVRDEGATMVEYGLILAVIAIIAVVGAAIVGTTTDAKFDSVSACISTNGSSC
ncbi:MAG: Flp family type IVb pilin [Acidimicrobiia bacterium]|nr:Flp family type IVb pilin [Acidimicrobiia bacterium]